MTRLVLCREALSRELEVERCCFNSLLNPCLNMFGHNFKWNGLRAESVGYTHTPQTAASQWWENSHCKMGEER